MSSAVNISHDAATPKKRGRPFASGQSGNPRGRPAGEESKAARLRKTIQAHMPALLDVVVSNAMAGDVQAARILIERAIAPLKPREATVLLAMPENASMTDYARAAIDAVSTGSMAVSQGATFINAINAFQHIVEVDDIVTRIAALEAMVRRE